MMTPPMQTPRAQSLELLMFAFEPSLRAFFFDSSSCPVDRSLCNTSGARRPLCRWAIDRSSWLFPFRFPFRARAFPNSEQPTETCLKNVNAVHCMKNGQYERE